MITGDRKITLIIPAAGVGSRMSTLSSYHKALLPINNLPVIAHVINQFKDISKVIIAIHEKEEILPSILEMLYPKKFIKFIKIKERGDNGGSLANTLNEMLQTVDGPFYFNPCDSFSKQSFESSNENIIYGFSPKNLINPNQYRSIRVNQFNKIEISEKQNSIFDINQYIYTGTLYVHNWEKYTKDFKKNYKYAKNCNDNLEKGEIYGIDINGTRLKILEDWQDCGNLEEYHNTLKSYKSYSENAAPRILPKFNEGIYFNQDDVIKFSTDKEFITRRVERGEILNSWVPKIFKKNSFCYKYKIVDGSVLSDVIDLGLFKLFLDHMKIFWSENNLNNVKIDYTDFYKNKTLKRLELYFEKEKEIPKYINYIDTSNWNELLNNAFDIVLEKSISGNFHGDLHFENIIYNHNNGKFTLLDWRQDFQGSVRYGDIYYDLSKILHGIVVPHSSVTNNLFKINNTDNSENIDIYIERPEIYKELEDYFFSWCEENNFDLIKIKVLTALIFINIAPLHHTPYNKFLFYLGLFQLKKNLR